MSRGLLARFLTLGALSGATACSLLVDTSEIDAGCGSGMKYCEQKCVAIDEPFYGCADECNPCAGEHIVHRCEAGRCVFVTCLHGWGCANCSANLFIDPKNCGTCGHNCGDGTCADGLCVSDGGIVDPGTGGQGGVAANTP